MDGICDTQQDFNLAFNQALNQYRVKEMQQLRKNPVYIIVMILYLVFMIWGVFLALRVKEKEHRILHVTLALIAGPLYVFGYYLSQ